MRQYKAVRIVKYHRKGLEGPLGSVPVLSLVEVLDQGQEDDDEKVDVVYGKDEQGNEYAITLVVR